MARPWSPLVPYATDDGTRCVDIFVRADGTFGFEVFRRDVEDGGTWYITGHYNGRRFASRADAEAAAKAAAPWQRSS